MLSAAYEDQEEIDDDVLMGFLGRWTLQDVVHVRTGVLYTYS